VKCVFCGNELVADDAYQRVSYWVSTEPSSTPMLGSRRKKHEGEFACDACLNALESGEQDT